MSEPAVYLIDHDEPKEWPMLFSAPMVLALLDGRKTMTRRIVSPQNSLVNGWPTMKRSNGLDGWPDLDLTEAWLDKGPSPAGNAGPYLKVPGGDESVHRVYSRVQVGDRIWVKETWRAIEVDDGRDGVAFAADRVFIPIANTPEASEAWMSAYANRKHGDNWRPSIFMPRWASRITLEVTAVSVERVQDISEDDARAEGASFHDGHGVSAFGWRHDDADGYVFDTAARAFQRLWERINGRRPGCDWESNPRVWVIEFRRIAHKEDTTG